MTDAAEIARVQEAMQRLPPIKSAQDAVRASIAAETRREPPW